MTSLRHFYIKVQEEYTFYNFIFINRYFIITVLLSLSEKVYFHKYVNELGM